MESYEDSLETPVILKESYEYIRCLGEGAQVRTYLARKNDTDEFVAVKELKFNEVDSFKGFELFMRECEVLADLNDPGVPKFYERVVPKDGHGSCYIIQEFIQATSIQKTMDLKMRSGKLSFTVDEVLDTIKSVAEILNRLETNYVPAIVHRDIKPSNIMYRIRKGEMQCWLIDFGAVANPQKRSNSSTVAGTCGYMAPEQLMGMCTPASDIYSLGMTAVHMLTEEPPWKMPVEGLEIRYEPILRKVRPDLKENVVQLLRLMTDVSLDNRLGTAGDVLDILEEMDDKLHSSKRGEFRRRFEESLPESMRPGARLNGVQTQENLLLKYIQNNWMIIFWIVMGVGFLKFFVSFWHVANNAFILIFIGILVCGLFFAIFMDSRSQYKHERQAMESVGKSEKLGRLEMLEYNMVQTDGRVEDINPIGFESKKYIVEYLFMVKGVYYSGIEMRTMESDNLIKRGELIKVIVPKSLV